MTMNAVNQAQKNILKAKKWLSSDVLPLWFGLGFETASGCFLEWISYDSKPLIEAERRAMVQARQIYSVCEASRLQLMTQAEASELVRANVNLLFRHYKRPSGGYAHALNHRLEITNDSVELYTQAFILFCLSQAYGLLKDENIRTEALSLLDYLNTKRRIATGGFTEIKNGKVLYQSNPHMHLFEAALAWVAVDHSESWKQLAEELKNICLNHFIDPTTNLLAEHFSEPWLPEASNGQFVFEPGHHYEWAWLLLEYQKLLKTDLLKQAQVLFANAETYGLSSDRKFAVDEVWSNFKINKNTSRFWPHCERIKAAVSLAVLSQNAEEKQKYFESADLAFEGLATYLETPVAGLWHDTRLADGSFKSEPAAKASSLYHIINAYSEYINKRI